MYRALVPIDTDSGFTATLSATPNTDIAVPVPAKESSGFRPRAFMIAFFDGSGNQVVGRLAVTGSTNDVTVTATNLGYVMPAWCGKEWCLPEHAKNLIVASPTASAVVYVTWLYEYIR